MTILAQGTSRTFTVPAGRKLNISNARGRYRAESPPGTVISTGATATLGPFTAQVLIASEIGATKVSVVRQENTRTAPVVGALTDVLHSDGKSIGIGGNVFETLGTTSATTQSAIVPMAPSGVQRNLFQDSIQILANWYQDFGLAANQLDGTAYKGWYDWSWNHVNTNGFTPTTGPQTGVNQGYFKDRHPMLGWYHGDDPKVLSWQVKWMLEAGVHGTIVQQRTPSGDFTAGGNWTNASNIDNWIWQLLNKVPNVGGDGLLVSFWLPLTNVASPSGWASVAPTYSGYDPSRTYIAGETVLNNYYDNRIYRAKTTSLNKQPNEHISDNIWELVTMPAAWQTLVTNYANNASKIFTINRGGKKYALVYMFEGESCRSAWGTGTLQAWLKELGAAMHTANPDWEGVAVLARNSTAPSKADGITYGGLFDYDALETGRCLYLRGAYNGHECSPGATSSYQSIIDNFRNTTYKASSASYAESRRVYAVPTAMQSVLPHDTGFPFAGHSPAKFGAFVSKIRQTIEQGKGYPMLTIYNVSEWAEGGPGLQPNKQDGFGYLDALRDAMEGA
jgi:hypothetical protein